MKHETLNFTFPDLAGSRKPVKVVPRETRNLKHGTLNNFFKVLFAASLLAACANDPKEVANFSDAEEIPLEVQEDLVLTYSDSAFVRLQLQAPVAESYPQLEEPERRFPKGLDVKFFDSFGDENSRMRANSATQFTQKNLWHAKGNVVVVNDKGEQLNTEELFWDENKERIWSDVFVKMTTEKEIIMGEGFEADQDFNEWTVKKVTGQIAIDDEEDA